MRQEARVGAKSVRAGGALASSPTGFCRRETTCQKCARPAARDWRRWSPKTASQSHPATPRPSTTRSKSFTLRGPLLPGVGVYAQTPTRSNAAVSTRNEAVRGGTGVAVYSRLAREKPGKNRRRTEREGLITKKSLLVRYLRRQRHGFPRRITGYLRLPKFPDSARNREKTAKFPDRPAPPRS